MGGKRLKLAFILGAAVLCAGVAVFAVLLQDKEPALESPAGHLLIQDENGIVLEGLHLSSTEGPCLVIRNSTDVTIRNSEIGPCGGNAIQVYQSAGIQVLDNYVHPEFPVDQCCDTGDGIFVQLSSGLLIQGNIVAYGETNIEMQAVDDAQIIGNFLLNPLGPFPRGQQVQVWGLDDERSSDIVIEDNYTLSSKDPRFTFPEDQEDAINVGFTDGAIVRNNYVAGGSSDSGCGIIADVSANLMRFLDNTIVDTGQCGIGIASGEDQVVSGNVIFNHGLDAPDAGNTALYVWNQYDAPCGPVEVSDNVAVLRRPDGSYSSFWEGSGCEPVMMDDNTFDDDAYSALSPIEDKYPPPAIPPRPFERPPPAPPLANLTRLPTLEPLAR